MALINRLQNSLIVSCQALENEPLHGPMLMAAMARAAQIGGAKAIRVNGAHDVEVCKAITQLPIIGIKKIFGEYNEICITPYFACAKELAEAGADIIALDFRTNLRFGEPLPALVSKIQNELNVLVMADCQTLEDANNAVFLGVDIVGSTFGFKETSQGIQPDFYFLSELVKLPLPIFAEGGFWTPDEVVKAFEIGVWTVVVGSAITRPQHITSRFVKAMELAGYDRKGGSNDRS